MAGQKRKKLNLKKTTVKFLEDNLEERFTAREIAEWIYDNYTEECEEKKERSNATVYPLNTHRDLITAIAREVGSAIFQFQEKNSEIKNTEGRPRKYYFTESTDDAEGDQAESDAKSPTSEKKDPAIKEPDLYPLLSEFLWFGLKIYNKRIDDKKSSHTQGPKGNKWLHPDLVGMEDLSTDWDDEIKKCVKQHTDKRIKLWSFEVKRRINRTNVRKAFLQAVSNSSWANFGYLVTTEIEGKGTLKELRILASLHGIGLIELNVGEPLESQIMIPAKERNEIDWNTANRLIEEKK